MSLPTTLPNSAATIIGRKTFAVITPTGNVTQIETATAAGSVTGSGNASVTVTGAGITGSPVALSVAVLSGDTPAMWAQKVRLAIAANGPISALYNVSYDGSANIVLTRILAAANDATLNIALATGTATGITAAPTSVHTRAGTVTTIASIAYLMKKVTLSSAMTSVERKTVLNGLIQSDRVVPVERNTVWTLTFDEIPQSLMDLVMSGVPKTGTLQIVVSDPDDAAGTCALQSNVHSCRFYLDGNIDFNRDNFSEVTIKADAQEDVTYLIDAAI